MSFPHIFFVVLFIVSILCTTSETKHVKEQTSVRLMNAVHGDVLMPVVGLGTFGYGRPDGSRGEYWGPEQGHNSTVAWLKAGGRRLDSSNNYASCDGVGTGWVASGVPRSEIFITSKLDPFGYNQTLEQFAGILTSLRTNYIDLLLIHWPGDQPGRSEPPCKQGQATWTQCRIQTWRAMETIFNQGQVEFHPYWHEDDLLDFCKKHNITFNSYSPGGAPDYTTTLGPTWNPIPEVRKNPNVTAIAQKHGKTPSQILFRWHWQQGIVINPRTRDLTHMMENLSIFDFQLDNQDMMILSYLNHPMSKVCPDPRLIL